MAKEYLKGSIFDSDALQTKVKTNRITTKERFLGHILGPGMVYVYYCVILGLRELYYILYFWQGEAGLLQLECYTV